ncbi:hypothetical protein [Caballeronia sp. Lep1P3]|uniref:hypothetical protein n=1 Tax=Caballeronia sp. Lep1P3 TaxID=2878150 RepID=UPI001FD43DBA|nr:hypothetical protein [Caballeronia sp. Lep1P3]
MAAKMWVAATMDGEEVFAETIGILPEAPPLRCRYCGTPVSYVPQHARESRGKTYAVKAYFRLLPKAAHNEQCTFNVEEQLEVIARRSLGLLQALERGQYRFRLLAIDATSNSEVRLTRSAISRDAHMAGNGGALFSSDSGRLLATYINAAKRVIYLRALCANDPLLCDRLEFVFNGMSVSWENFYYEEGRFLAAYRWLGQTVVPFPIALVGRVSSVETIETHGRLLHVLKFEPSAAQPYSYDPAVGELTHATVWTTQSNWLHPLKSNDRVLVFGHWRQARANTFTRLAQKGDTKFRKYLDRQLSVWLHVKSQVSRIMK